MNLQMIMSLRNSTAKVLLFLLLSSKPQDEYSIQKEAKQSKPTVEQAIDELKSAQLIKRVRGGYVALENFLSQKSFLHDDDNKLSTEEIENQHHAEKVFSSMKDSKGRSLNGEPLRWLCENVDEQVALQWGEWIQKAPSDIGNPIGFMISCLRVNQNQLPPALIDKPQWFAEAK